MQSKIQVAAFAASLAIGCGSSVDLASGTDAVLGAGRSCTTAVSPFERVGCTTGQVRAVRAGPGFFEGVTVSTDGDIYTSDQGTMDVYRITPQGDAEVIAHLYDPPTNDGMYAGTLGLTFSPDGALWIVLVDLWGDSRHHGIWRVARDGSSGLVIPFDVNAALFLNALTFDDRGNLYVTESTSGTIWKVARGERVAHPWLQHALLGPLPTMYGFGANGIVHKCGALYVVNTDQGTVVRVPIDERGAPGSPTVFASGLDAPDGLTAGPWNDLYVPLVFSGRLVRIAADGTWEVAAETGLPYTTSAIFGAGAERTTAYVVNFLSSPDVPMLVKVNLCVR